MLLYIIDGFNLVHKIPSVRGSESPQFELIQYIKKNKLGGSFRNSVVIIYDGMPQANVAGEREFQIIFSQGRSADELIKQRIDKIKSNGKYPISEVVVVSDDREIREHAIKSGAVSLRTMDFLKVKKESSKEYKQEDKDISFPLQREITEELRKIWLKE
ncbi:MAG: NYN domain-containing protein [Candidatus Omnitrophota bacterium]|jgi:predicted RNA-binding protein with PIN domain